jgi:hypothetical protein
MMDIPDWCVWVPVGIGVVIVAALAIGVWELGRWVLL